MDEQRTVKHNFHFTEHARFLLFLPGIPLAQTTANKGGTKSRLVKRSSTFSGHKPHLSLRQLAPGVKPRRTSKQENLGRPEHRCCYAKLDRCKSKIGQQYLYAMLRHPISNKGKLEERNAAITFFQEQVESRIAVQVELQRLNEQLSYSIPNIIFNWKLDVGINKLLILALSLLPLFVLGLCIWVSKAFALLLAISFFLNLIFHYRNKSRVESFISPFSQIPALRASALRLSRIHLSFQNEEVQTACKKLAALGRYQFLLQSEKPGQNDFSAILWLFLEYLKITFLVEINLLERCLEISRNAKSEIHTHISI